MMAGVEIFNEYGYVVIVLVLYIFLDFWMSIEVRKARRKYGVYFPTLYVTECENKDAKLFNCFQRAHHNSLEMMPVFFAMLLVCGIQHPRVAAALGVLYTVFRFVYFKAYSTGLPQDRLRIWGLNFLAVSGLIICSISSGISLILRRCSDYV